MRPLSERRGKKAKLSNLKTPNLHEAQEISRKSDNITGGRALSINDVIEPYYFDIQIVNEKSYIRFISQ